MATLIPAAAGPTQQLGFRHCCDSASESGLGGVLLLLLGGGPPSSCLGNPGATASLSLPLNFRLRYFYPKQNFFPVNVTKLSILDVLGLYRGPQKLG